MPPYGIPLDVGCVVNNIETFYNILRAILYPDLDAIAGIYTSYLSEACEEFSGQGLLGASHHNFLASLASLADSFSTYQSD